MSQNDSKSLGELMADLSRETSSLIRKEVHLAKTEMTEKAVSAGKGAAGFVVAGVMALFALQALLAAAVIGLAAGTTIPLWGCALIVAGVLFAIAGLCALFGKANLAKMKTPVPEQTVESVKEDVQWARRQIN